MVTFCVVMGILVFSIVLVLLAICKREKVTRRVVKSYVVSLCMGFLISVSSLIITPIIVRNKLDTPKTFAPNIERSHDQEYLGEIYELHKDSYKKIPRFNRWLKNTKILIDFGFFWDLNSKTKQSVMLAQPQTYIYYENGKYYVNCGGDYIPDDWK